MIDKEVRLAMFSNEIGSIQDKNLKTLAEELIINADEYFFSVAASTSGKYHPQFDLGEGGLVRHTRCVVFFAQCIAESSMFSAHDKDLMTVAALAHDIKKLGNDGSQHTVGDHPIHAAKYVREIAEQKKVAVSQVDIDTIAGMVESHMGKWGQRDGNPLPKTTLEIALQNADYIASRKEILDFDFKETSAVMGASASPIDEQKAPAANTGELKDFVITFGKKHNGQTLEEIYKSGDDYLQWIARQDNFFNVDVQNTVKAYLASLESGAPAVSTDNNTQSNDKDDLPF